jgi:hypothetical protein
LQAWGRALRSACYEQVYRTIRAANQALPAEAKLGVGDRAAGDEGVDRVLVEGVTELHDDVVDHSGLPRVGQQQGQRVAVGLQAVDLSDADQAVGLERFGDRVGERTCSRSAGACTAGAIA